MVGCRRIVHFTFACRRIVLRRCGKGFVAVELCGFLRPHYHVLRSATFALAGKIDIEFVELFIDGEKGDITTERRLEVGRRVVNVCWENKYLSLSELSDQLGKSLVFM